MAGFEPDENILPVHRRSMDGHRLLQEYFTLPEKFLFFDIEGLEVLDEMEASAARPIWCCCSPGLSGRSGSRCWSLG